MKLSEVYEAIGMMDVGMFIQSSRFWRDLDENLGNVAKLGMGFVPKVSGIDAFAA